MRADCIFLSAMGIEKSGKIEEGTKVEKMPGRAWGKGEEISQEEQVGILLSVKINLVEVKKKQLLGS